MLHMDRQGGTWKLLGSVVFIHRQVCLPYSNCNKSQFLNGKFIGLQKWPLHKPQRAEAAFFRTLGFEH